MAPGKPTFEGFPQVTHQRIDANSKCDGSIECQGTIVPQVRGQYVALRCGGCGAVLGAIDPEMLRALITQTAARDQAA